MDESAVPVKSRDYQRIHQRITLFSLVWNPLLLLLLVLTPASLWIKETASAAGSQPMTVLAVYFLILSAILWVVDLPLSFYSGYLIEHRFGLSNQTPAGWILFLLKRTALSMALSLALIAGLYALIWHFPDRWWLLAWAAYAVVSFVLGKMFPVWIVPLFYRYEKVPDEALRRRIFELTNRYGLPVENLYSLNLSKTTKKANAAFMGIGKSKRVVLSDTLLEQFNSEEIETVVAHELGHYKHRDILKQIALGSVVSLAGFFLASGMLSKMAGAFGFDGVGDPAAMPLLFLVFSLMGLIWTPAQSAFSRCLERAADRFALEALRAPEVFISCMEKLGRVNLAETSPHPVYEWYFYDHPSIPRRIAMARHWDAENRGG